MATDLVPAPPRNGSDAAPRPPAFSAPTSDGAPVTVNAPEVPAAPSRSKAIRLGILATLLLVGGFFGVRAYRHHQLYATTDNAAIEGHLAPALSRVEGYVSAVLVEEDQTVTAGQLLVRMDSTDLDLKVQEAETALAGARAALVAAEAQVGAAESNVQAAQRGVAVQQEGIANARDRAQAAAAAVAAARVQSAQAARERARYADLVAGNAAPGQALDNATSAAEAAAAGVTVAARQADVAASSVAQAQASAAQAQQNVSTARQAITTARAAVDQARAVVAQREVALAQARQTRTYGGIRAPISGRVEKVDVEPGQYVRPGQPLLMVAGTGTVWVTANFKEKQLGRLHAGQPAEIRLDAFEGQVLKGHVASIAGATGSEFALLPPDNASGNFVKVARWIPVRIALDGQTPASLLPGLNAEVSVRTN